MDQGLFQTPYPLLQVGDASGIQSPVSFGGFGSMTRHLGRLTHGNFVSFFLLAITESTATLLHKYLCFFSSKSKTNRTYDIHESALGEIKY